MEYWQLTTDQLMALMAVNYGPAKRCSDGRWRSAWKDFPADGIAHEEMSFLCKADLVEYAGNVAIATELGRSMLHAGEWLRPFEGTPARPGTQSAHFSIQ